MRSSVPKVLHPVCGKPMVHWVVDAARAAGATDVVCVTRPGDGVAQGLPEGVALVEQSTGEGTGAAVLAAREAVPSGATVVVLSGDHPLVSSELIEELVAGHRSESAAATLLTTEGLDPAGYGRIVRAADGSFERIVETKETDGVSAEELAIREVNMGTYAFQADELFEALAEVGTERGEIYLTAVLPLLRERGGRVVPHLTDDLLSATGANTRLDLMNLERDAQRLILERHALAGVTFQAPDSVRVEVGVEIDGDTTIGPGVTLRGATRIGAGCEIGPQTTITDSVLADGVRCVHSFLVEAEVDAGAQVGPFAYLRPKAHIGEGAKIGTFVEVKNSEIGASRP
jgi:bifunctional UDP-N-acetylglucosamine pyrophosphorylase/glucosamine-1-phosphate N-acetyltransferase